MGTAPCFGNCNDTITTVQPLQITADCVLSAGVDIAVTQALKATVHRMRPNREDTHSFPSRHTSVAFMASTLIANETYRYSAWYPVGAHLVASVIGVQRVASMNHYGTDVAAGFAVGVLSTEFATALSRLVFKGNSPGLCYFDYNGRHTGISSSLILPLGHKYASGWRTSGSLAFPVSDWWTLGGKLSYCALSPTASTHPGKAVHQTSLCLEARWKYVLPCRALSLSAGADAGPYYAQNISKSKFGAVANADIGLNWRITPTFGASASTGILTSLSRQSFCAITVSVASTAYF